MEEEIAILHSALMPVLSNASVGKFDSEIVIDSKNSQRVNEILMGVEVLLEVILQKNEELERLLAERPPLPEPAPNLLDEILHRSAN